MDDPPYAGLIHRETRMLMVLILVAVAAFIGTRAVAYANRARRQLDADAWLVRGQQSLRRHDPARAAQELRRAANLDPANVKTRLQLGTALAAAGAADEARRVLLAARSAAPEDAGVSLALGRLAASGNDMGTAITAYHAALNNLWRPEETAARYQVRVELARYLLAHDQRSRALSELLLVGAELPDTAAAHADLAAMLMTAGEPARALTALERAAALEPANQAVRLAAGQAAFALGDDRRTLRHLRAAPDIAAARDLAATSEFALSLDPLLPRLTLSERERRLRAGLAQATSRLDQCGPAAAGRPGGAAEPLRERLNRFEASLLSGARPHDPHVADLLDDGVELIAQIEASTTGCAVTTPLDEALALIGRRHEGRP
jgi:tetratricopeptide (TPR) repeat protein